MKFPIPLLPVVLSARVFAQDDCVSSNLSAQPPASGTGVVLQSFELCKNGSLFASAFVEVSSDPGWRLLIQGLP